MTKKVIVIISLFLGFISFSQENTASPYSYYGIGEVKFRGTEAERAMGSLAITGDSITVNLLNPASYSHLKLTNFSIGGTSSFFKMKNATNSESTKRTSIDYLTVSIPMGKFGASIGLIPYSAVGYKINNKTTSSNNTSTKQFTGSGNINKIYLGASYNLNKSLSFGANIEYNFGNLENKIIENNSNETIIRFATRELNTARLNGINLNLGMLYNTKINNKLTFFGSATLKPEATLTSKNTRNIATTFYGSNNGSELVYEPRDILLKNSKIIIPTKFSFGAGIGENNKWLLGADITLINSEKQSNVFDSNRNSSYRNGQTYVLGGYYIPDYDSFSSYFNRVVYRAGFRYENTGLIINNQNINNYGMNFGLGLPLGASKIDLSFEYGKRGTTTNNLIQENYFNLSIGLSISDKWFRKILID